MRAGIAARLCELAGWSGPIVPGIRTPKSGREVWWAGFEGTNFDSLESPLIRGDLDAASFLAQRVAAAEGELDVLAIGPLTNIAAAIELDPLFAGNVRHLYVMGGQFGVDAIEHNFKCDVDAARVVFASGIRCTVTGLEATSSVRLEAEDFNNIESAGPLGAVLKREIASFLGYTGRDWSSPHDPMSLLPLLHDDHFEYSTGTIEIGLEPADPGRSVLRPQNDGNARIVSGWDGEWVRATVRDLVLAGCRTSRPT